MRYSGAEAALAAFASKHRVPVVETIAGRTVLVHDHPMNAGPIGGLGSNSANHLAAEADVVLAVGTRLQDFTTGSWSLFADDARFIGLNAARFDARKHQALPVVGDAQAGARGAGPGAARLAGAGVRGSARRGGSMPSGTTSSTSAAARPTPSCRPTPTWWAP